MKLSQEEARERIRSNIFKLVDNAVPGKAHFLDFPEKLAESAIYLARKYRIDLVREFGKNAAEIRRLGKMG